MNTDSIEVEKIFDDNFDWAVLSHKSYKQNEIERDIKMSIRQALEWQKEQDETWILWYCNKVIDCQENLGAKDEVTQAVISEFQALKATIKQLQSDYMAVQNELNVAQMKREDGWISVEDKLPEAGERVLFGTKDWYCIGKLVHFIFEADDEHSSRIYPTHWQPLPPAPKKEQK